MAKDLISVNVEADAAELARKIGLFRSRLPKVQARAINEVFTNARKEGTKGAADTTRLPLRAVRNRLDISGKIKGDRVVVKQARPDNPAGYMSVYLRGIPVILIGAKQNKGKPVKAYGGRTYERSFIAKAGSGTGKQVYTRLGKKRTPLGVVKIGVRERLIIIFNQYMSTRARAIFIERFSRLAKYELTKQ